MRSFAIVLVCYNRLDGLVRLLNSLDSADYDNRKDIHLIFSIDYSGSKTITDFADGYIWRHGEKHIRSFDSRQGLKKHILACGDYTSEYDIVVVLEDDIYVSDSFYRYAYNATNFYWEEDNIAGISLYCFQKNWLDWPLRFEPRRVGDNDVFFLKVAQSWGQVWTKRKWVPFKEWLLHNPDFYENTDDIPEYLITWPESSWLKYHDKYLIKSNKYFVYPFLSYSTNFSDAGEHSKFLTSDHQVELVSKKSNYVFPRFADCSVRYDQYMNPEGLERYIGIDKCDLCVDLWGTRPLNQKRYLLSTDYKPYKIVKSYQLSLRPIELSIIFDLPGEGIYLYDTSIRARTKRFNGRFNRYNYSIRTRESRKMLMFSIKLRCFDLKNRIENKLYRFFKR